MAVLNGLGIAPKWSVNIPERERFSLSHRSCARAINCSGGPAVIPSRDSNFRNSSSCESAWATAPVISVAVAATSQTDEFTTMAKRATDHAGARLERPLLRRADEIEHQVGYLVRLVELEEVSGVVDHSHVAVGGQRVGDPACESRCHATVVAA